MVEDEEVPVHDSLLDALILPSNTSIGIQILKKMGWKPGQGVGEKTEAVHNPNQQGKGKKVSKPIFPCLPFVFMIILLKGDLHENSFFPEMNGLTERHKFFLSSLNDITSRKQFISGQNEFSCKLPLLNETTS